MRCHASFDEDVLTILLAEDDVGQCSRLFAWLRSLPFVTDNAGRCHYHAVVRAAMVRLERRQSPTRWRQRHHALADAYRSWRTAQFPQDCWDYAAWRALRLEETYHLLCADPGQALPNALTDVVHACAEQPATAAQWAQAIAQAGQDTDSATVQAYGQDLAGAVRLNPYMATVACLDSVLASGRLPAEVLPLALRTRGRALYYLDRDAEALVDLTKAITLVPGDSRALALRGAAYQWLGRHRKGLADLDKAIELDPSYQWAIAVRGETYRQMERFEQALTDFDRAIELDPADQWAIARRGETYRQMERFEQALTDFDRAIELSPADQWAIARRGETYRQMERFEQALTDFDRAIELDPADQWAIASRGQTYRQMGRFEQALTDMDKAIELNTGNDWIYYLRSLVLLDLGQTSHAHSYLRKAVDQARKTISLGGTSSNDAYNIAVYLAAEGRFEEAEQALRDALASCPSRSLESEVIDDLRDLAGVQVVESAKVDELIAIVRRSRSEGA